MNDIQASYNTAAADYHAILKDYHQADPFELGALDYFTRLVQPSGRGDSARGDGGRGDGGRDGPVGDLGCGTGRITAHLAERGLDVFGIDLTPGMIEVARHEYPGLRFEVGSLFDLNLRDGELAGALAWYSLVHTPREDLPAAFAELFRVIRPGGHLLHGFKVGGGIRPLTHAYGHDINLEVHSFDLADITALLTTTGFTEVAALTRTAFPAEKDPAQAALILRKPE
jgi:SAM-dependent methyltransferase